jgi:hypothetical protein
MYESITYNGNCIDLCFNIKSIKKMNYGDTIVY